MVREAGPQDVLVAVLLAGGAGRRIGADKRYLVLEGETLLLRNLAFLRRIFPTVAVSVAPDQTLDLDGDMDVELLPDTFQGASPLVGIATALARYRRPLFVMAVDIGFPDAAAVARLLGAFPGHDVALPAVGSHLEPLFAVYGPACLPPMQALLATGRHRIVEAFPGLEQIQVGFPDARPFLNINTLDTYREAQLIAGATGRSAAVTEPAAEAARRPGIVAIVGKSDAGKTTFIEKLVPELLKFGLRIGLVKHDAHGFDIDHPGKDSWRHGRTGAEAYAIASPDRIAYVGRLERELPLVAVVERYFAAVDLVVAEGYKRTAPHRIEVFRRGAGHDGPLCRADEALALISDAPLPHEHRFGMDDAQDVARFLVARLQTLRLY